jgi:hypothetical protein
MKSASKQFEMNRLEIEKAELQLTVTAAQKGSKAEKTILRLADRLQSLCCKAGRLRRGVSLEVLKEAWSK